jgi:transcriptional regulator with XRE-family HTH domain
VINFRACRLGEKGPPGAHNRVGSGYWLAISYKLSQSYLSAIEHGRNEVGAEVLLAIGREFGKSIDWLLTGKE